MFNNGEEVFIYAGNAISKNFSGLRKNTSYEIVWFANDENPSFADSLKSPILRNNFTTKIFIVAQYQLILRFALILLVISMIVLC